MPITAKEIGVIIEKIPFHGGGAEGALWAVNEIIKKLAVDGPRLFVEGWDLDGPRVSGECICRKSVALDQITEMQQVCPIGRDQTTIVRTVNGSRIDAGMPYDEFKTKYLGGGV
jgi:hypothetical protein